MSGAIGLDWRGRTAILMLDQTGRRNAISRAMWAMLAERTTEAVSGGRALALILTGAGGHFAAGADISEFGETFGSPEAAKETNALVQAALLAVQGLPIPVIAAVEGTCIGGGVSLMLQADLAFAGATASFAITPAKLGLVYGAADTTRLVSRIGAARAKDLLFSGRMLAADEALRIGLVDHLAPAGGALAAALSYAQGLAAQSQSSIRATKALIDGPASTDRFVNETNAATAGADFAEGRAAFLAKRKPIFPSAQ
jgi:enoyl-CoA hydratase/carnithine racemase